MRLVRALVLVLVLAGPAQAIVIESGFVSGGVVSDFFPFFDLRGEGFEARGVGFNQVFMFPQEAIGAKRLVVGPPFPSTVPATVDISHTLRIETFPSAPPNPELLHSGRLTFDVEPFLVNPPVQGVTTGQPSTFTMTGVLDGVSLEGGGTVSSTWFHNGVDGNPLSLRFEFSPVPEPATLTLFGTVGGLGALYRWRKRRAARPHEGISSE